MSAWDHGARPSCGLGHVCSEESVLLPEARPVRVRRPPCPHRGLPTASPSAHRGPLPSRAGWLVLEPPDTVERNQFLSPCLGSYHLEAAASKGVAMEMDFLS